VPVGTPSESIF